MKSARLIRISQDKAGTFGVFVTAGGWWYSMELPWRDNTPHISCIPKGDYECHFTYSESKEKNLYILGHVDERSGIRIHAANCVSQLEGCIALGNRYSSDDEGMWLTSSQAAIRAFHKVMGGEPFNLTIQDRMA